MTEICWEDGSKADINDPKVKYSCQRTGQVPVAFSRKADASRFISELVRDLKADGWVVQGNDTVGRRCYRGEEAVAILLTSRKH